MLCLLRGPSYSSIPKNMCRGKGQLFRAQHFIKPIARGYNIAARVELVSLLLKLPWVADLFARLSNSFLSISAISQGTSWGMLGTPTAPSCGLQKALFWECS